MIEYGNFPLERVKHNMQFFQFPKKNKVTQDYPCSTKRREVLGNQSRTPKRFCEIREKSRGRRGWISQYLPSTDILLIINPSIEMGQEIHTYGQGRIDSVKINPSLLRMRECAFVVVFCFFVYLYRLSSLYPWICTNVVGVKPIELLVYLLSKCKKRFNFMFASLIKSKFNFQV